jgi:beta-galactosidase
MAKVQIQNHKLKVGAQDVPMVSGEIHYWRLQVENWKPCLDKIRQMGLNVISTYIPWDYHEYKQGKFDFTGRTAATRNLVQFLKLVKQEKFWLIIRPGPYIYSEWPNDGVPSYVRQYHRLHPQFLRFAERYLTEVSRIIRPFLATKGGPIILLQVDNEMDPWPDLYGEQLGLGNASGLFQEFLEQKYEEVGSLNEAWNAQLSSFGDARSMFEVRLEGEKELRRVIDYYEFKHDYSRKLAETLTTFYRQLKIDVPIYANVYSFFYAHDWAKVQEVCDLTGIDLYLESEFSAEASSHRKMMDKIRLLRTVSPLPFVAEFQSGIWHYQHYKTGVLTPNHYRLLCVSALLAGIQGWNWYMLVNRDNWYMSPIDEWGRERGELFSVFAQMVRIFNHIKPSELKKITDLSVTFHPIHHATKTLPKESALLNSLYETGMDYECFDPRLAKIEKPVMFYSGAQWLDQASQEHLNDYVQRGGHLVVFRDYPRKDDQFENLNLLGLADPDGVLYEFKKKISIRLGKEHVTLVSSVGHFLQPPRKPIWAEIEGVGKKQIGYELTKGQGTVLHLSLDPSPEMLLAVLRYYQATIAARSLTTQVQCALYSKGGQHYLIVTNNGNEDKEAVIELDSKIFKKKKFQAKELIFQHPVKMFHDHQWFLTLSVPRKDGRVVQIS